MSTKLRASCDTCHRAKLKCVRRGPKCQRCDYSGEQCIYSPALPRVYQRRKGRESIFKPVHESDVPSTGKPSMTEHQYDVLSQQINGQSKLPTEASTTAFSHQGYTVTVAEPKELFWPWLPGGQAAGNDLAENHPLGTPALTTADTPVAPTTANSPASLLPLVSPSGSKQPGPPSPPIPPIIRHPNPTHSNGTDDPTLCNCFIRLHSAMQRMISHASMCGPPLDTVLDANRTAARHCIATLECRHGLSRSSNIDCISIACGLLDRVLSSYQVALESFSANTGVKEPDEKDCLRYSDKDGDAVIDAGTMQLRLGSFAVERSEQIWWAREIVVKEIRKLREVLEGYSRKGQDIRSVLLSHLAKRCTQVIDEIRG